MYSIVRSNFNSSYVIRIAHLKLWEWFTLVTIVTSILIWEHMILPIISELSGLLRKGETEASGAMIDSIPLSFFRVKEAINGENTAKMGIIFAVGCSPFYVLGWRILVNMIRQLWQLIKIIPFWSILSMEVCQNWVYAFILLTILKECTVFSQTFQVISL